MISQNEDPFDELLARLEPDTPNSETRYRQVRQRMIRFFEWRRCQTAAELADETIARLVKNVRRGIEVQGYPYLFEIAKNVYRETGRRAQRDTALANRLALRPVFTNSSSDCEVQCLKNLDPDKRDLITKYYLAEQTIEELAEQERTTVRNLRLRVHRIKKKLKECFQECQKETRIQ